ncbi:MAG: hypothetical protein AAF066_02545 [Pseudomonadota bacterium]
MFVLFAAALAAGILTLETSAIAVNIVTLSVAVSSQSDKLFGLFLRDSPRKELDEDFANAGDCVPIIGFGRVGQIAVEALLFKKTPSCVLITMSTGSAKPSFSTEQRRS